MQHLVIQHAVADFDAWKSHFVSHLPVREAAGLRNLHLWRNTDAPNEVVIIDEVTDEARARAFLASAELQATLKAHGVTSEPNFKFVDDAA